MEKILGAINLAQINNWENTEGVSNWVGITFGKLKKHSKDRSFQI